MKKKQADSEDEETASENASSKNEENQDISPKTHESSENRSDNVLQIKAKLNEVYNVVRQIQCMMITHIQFDATF